jgi:hypothetical protein
MIFKVLVGHATMTAGIKIAVYVAAGNCFFVCAFHIVSAARAARVLHAACCVCVCVYVTYTHTDTRTHVHTQFTVHSSQFARDVNMCACVFC